MRLGILLVLLLALPAVSQERRLVRLENTAGGLRAVISPETDYTVFRRHEYRVEGLSLAPHAGPVRLLASFQGDRAKVRPGRAPAVLALEGSQAWRGRMRARLVSPGRVRLELGAGQTLEAELAETGNPPGETFWLTATCVRREGRWLALDPIFEKLEERTLKAGRVRLAAQLSEQFLDHSVKEFLYGHRHQLGWSSQDGSSSFRIADAGVTLLDCAPGQLRFYGTVTGQVAAIPVGAAQWEIAAHPRFEHGQLAFSLTPGSLRMRITRPVSMEAPPVWLEPLRELLQNLLGQSLKMPIPGAYAPSILETGILSPQDLEKMAIWTVPTGDRRSAFAVLAAPAAHSAEGPDLLRSRIRAPAEFCLSLSPEALTAALKRTVPRLLPLRRALPPEAQVKERIFIFTLRIREVEFTALDLAYRSRDGRGSFSIEDAVLQVYWDLGVSSGVEPGLRLKGYSDVIAAPGTPLRLQLQPDIQYLEFLSPHILSRSPAEQQALRERILAGVRGTRLDLPLPSRLPVPPLSGRAGLDLVGLEALPEELVIQGRLLP
ncbi:MAG: hypothetical protein HY319_24640 [Armatimonadetes bacterium]|nr:hypothetical protein [Armatimonadota bacterium]